MVVQLEFRGMAIKWEREISCTPIELDCGEGARICAIISLVSGSILLLVFGI